MVRLSEWVFRISRVLKLALLFFIPMIYRAQVVCGEWVCTSISIPWWSWMEDRDVAIVLARALLLEQEV